MNKILKQLPTYAYRTYRGGLELHAFLGHDDPPDCFQPEDWISSFTEAKNKNYIPNEGITRVLVDGKETLITEAVSAAAFGQGREDSGVLIKLLDAGERLGIQVHPTKEYARRIFDSSYGKTECWHILRTREGMDEPACVYLGFKEHVTRELWKDLFDRQDVQGMLDAMHRIEVKPGDTVLNIHIPSNGQSLSDEVRFDSYRRAREFFFPDAKGPIPFVCSSWLLWPEYEQCIPESSNIMRFRHDFTIVDAKADDGFSDGWRIFGAAAKKEVSEWPRDTSLRRAIAEFAEKGGRHGLGYGVFFFDGEKIIK